jgi:hypothetical protein
MQGANLPRDVPRELLAEYPEGNGRYDELFEAMNTRRAILRRLDDDYYERKGNSFASVPRKVSGDGSPAPGRAIKEK